MKKIVLFIFVFISNFSIVSAEKIEVKFSKCIDGDTAKFIYKKEEIKARFLAIDTPETRHPQKGEEPYGKEASEYTCKKIKNAKKIVLEYDDDSDKLDKFDRHLVWVFIDDSLLQIELIENGLASVAYLYGDYKYTDKLEEVEQDTKDKKIGIWSNKETNEEINYKEYLIIIGFIVMLCLFSAKVIKKVNNTIKKEIKKKA